ncbi:hypothetical protein ADT32_02125 [Xylella fastidiosa]|nr:hypothetical protein BC375_01725 [Xylella fastidiosa]KXB12654.1 hypothetical protein ADT32_02125 [Xylella fastidiosa]KXB13623.1 hypothetical protein ADT33_08160 [Xylella fastidiosa]
MAATYCFDLALHSESLGFWLLILAGVALTTSADLDAHQGAVMHPSNILQRMEKPAISSLLDTLLCRFMVKRSGDIPLHCTHAT